MTIYITLLATLLGTLYKWAVAALFHCDVCSIMLNKSATCLSRHSVLFSERQGLCTVWWWWIYNNNLLVLNDLLLAHGLIINDMFSQVIWYFRSTLTQANQAGVVRPGFCPNSLFSMDYLPSHLALPTCLMLSKSQRSPKAIASSSGPITAYSVPMVQYELLFTVHHTDMSARLHIDFSCYT